MVEIYYTINPITPGSISNASLKQMLTNPGRGPDLNLINNSSARRSRYRTGYNTLSFPKLSWSPSKFSRHTRDVSGIINPFVFHERRYLLARSFHLSLPGATDYINFIVSFPPFIFFRFLPARRMLQTRFSPVYLRSRPYFVKSRQFASARSLVKRSLPVWKSPQ